MGAAAHHGAGARFDTGVGKFNQEFLRFVILIPGNFMGMHHHHAVLRLQQGRLNHLPGAAQILRAGPGVLSLRLPLHKPQISKGERSRSILGHITLLLAEGTPPVHIGARCNLPQGLHMTGVHGVLRGKTQRRKARPPGHTLALPAGDILFMAGRTHLQHCHPAVRGFQDRRAGRLIQCAAGTTVSNAHIPQVPNGLAHPLLPVIMGVVVPHGQQVESQFLQIPGHLRAGGQPCTAAAGGSAQSTVGQGCLQIDKGNIALTQKRRQFLPPRIIRHAVEDQGIPGRCNGHFLFHRSHLSKF